MTDTETPTEPWLLATEAVKKYTLRAFRLPYYETTLEFIQVDHPDGTSSYFRGTGEGTVEPGPFGGGYCWVTPKYVVEAVTTFFNKIFPPTAPIEEETAA